MRSFVGLLGCVAMLTAISLVEAGGLVRKEDIPKYIKALKSGKDAKERATAAQMIGKRGLVNANDVEDAVEPLLKLMRKYTDATVRKQAVLAVGNIHPNAKAAVPQLVDVVKEDKVMDVKLAAATALGQFGNEASEAVPALRELQSKTKDKKSADFQTIAAAIKSITGKKK